MLSIPTSKRQRHSDAPMLSNEKTLFGESAAGGLKDLPPSPSSCCSVDIARIQNQFAAERFAPVPVGLLSGKKVVILECGFLRDQPYETAGAALLR